MRTAPLILVVQHEEDCPPALLGDWLVEAGCALDVRRPYAGESLPESAELTDHDGLLILGGPMGANDDDQHDWLGPLKHSVRAAAAIGLPTLGICLGHQVIATALGGLVDRNPFGQQVGLIDVEWTDAALRDELFAALATPRRGVQWNDDIVLELPKGATLLAATGRGEIQVARFAPAMWGVQLHPEVDVSVLRPWAASDLGSHQAKGIDQQAILRDIDAARAELDEAWRPLAIGFADRVATFAGVRAR